MASQGDTNEKEGRKPHEAGISHKKKKLSLKKKLLLGAVFLILLLLLSGWIYVNHLLGKINPLDSATISAEDFVEETDAISDDPSLETLSPEEITLRLANQVLKDKDVLNILLIGQDTQPGVSGSRSDSIILATVNQKKKEITITSFMRDLYVDIPGYKKSRINAAYALGGARLLDETIERNFGIHIDGNIAVNFTGFAKCIDIIGGVDLELSAAEAGAVNKELFATRHPILDGTDLQADRWALMGGFQHLNGDEALQYARIREIDSDFSRTNRQRKLLSAVFEKLKNSDLKTMNALLEEVLPLLSTDISNTKLIGYAAGVLAMQPATFKTDRIPADGAFREAVVHHMQVLVPDLEKNQLHLKESLYRSESTSYQPLPSTEAPRSQESRSTSNRSSAVQTTAPADTRPDTGNPNAENPGAYGAEMTNPDAAGSSQPYDSGIGSASSTPDSLSQEETGQSISPYESASSESTADSHGTDGQPSSYQYGPGMPTAEAAAGQDDSASESPAESTEKPSMPQDLNYEQTAPANPAYEQTAAPSTDSGLAAPQSDDSGLTAPQSADTGLTAPY
ncbi:MAG: LCP family protein [Lachnospiraceae bacterium]|nr:LCP family protein [Lachnospiraceae bacterium]